MKTILAVATALLCISVLCSASPIVTDPINPVEGDLEGALGLEGEPLGAKRVRRQEPSFTMTFTINGFVYTVNLDGNGFSIVDASDFTIVAATYSQDTAGQVLYTPIENGVVATRNDVELYNFRAGDDLAKLTVRETRQSAQVDEDEGTAQINFSFLEMRVTAPGGTTIRRVQINNSMVKLRIEPVNFLFQVNSKQTSSAGNRGRNPVIQVGGMATGLLQAVAAGGQARGLLRRQDN